jgi:hypothetical protein
MATAILSLVAYLLPLLVDGLKQYAERQKGNNHEANIQAFRQALGKGNRAGLSSNLADQHDRMLASLRGGGRQ